MSEIAQVETFGKDRGEDNPKDPSNIFESLEHGINLFQQNMKWKFLKILNMGPISRKHGLAILN